MKEDKISIIVPVYNVEKYLKKCVDSLLKQTYKNIEILLIDDGSTDSSPQICDIYSKKDKRVVVVHKSNGGVSDARNYGLNIAKGKYLAFVDSDDFVENDYLETLYIGIINSGMSISSCGASYYYDDGSVETYSKNNIIMDLGGEEAHKYLYIVGYYGVALWNKLFDKILFNGIRFPVNKKSEDIYVLYKLIEKSNGIYYNSNPKYYYRQRENSITKSSSINLDVIDAMQEVIKYYEDKQYYEAQIYSKRYLMFAYLGIYNAYLCRKNDKDKRKEVRKEALKLRKSINYKNIELKRKIQLRLFIYCIPLYNIIIKMKFKRNKYS